VKPKKHKHSQLLYSPKQIAAIKKKLSAETKSGLVPLGKAVDILKEVQNMSNVPSKKTIEPSVKSITPAAEFEITQSTLHRLKIIKKDIPCNAKNLHARSIIQHAIYHIQGKDISGFKHLSAKYDGKEEAPKPMFDPISIVKTAKDNLDHSLWSRYERILAHVISYLNGEDISKSLRFCIDHFEQEESDAFAVYYDDNAIKVNDKPSDNPVMAIFADEAEALDETNSIKVLEPALIQLGMLGREDGPLTRQEMRLDTDEIIIIKCCDGKGEHEYEEGDDAPCHCVEATCGCICDNENQYQCSCCKECEDCCSDCFTCESCDERKPNIIRCNACERCKDCCQEVDECWYCNGCDSPKNSNNDEYICGNCSMCESCCPCKFCEACDSKHNCDTPFCSSCCSCMDSCGCTICKGCGDDSADFGDDITWCTGCNHCSDCGCQCGKKKGVKSPNKILPSMPHDYAAVTQKAKGFLTLKSYAKYNNTVVPPFSVKKVKETDPDCMVGMFVRPCPTVPRHGFVDSRLVSTKEEANLLIDETIKADASSEFIIMNKFDAQHSGIWTPGLIVVGPGNDGATAGHGSVSIQVAGELVRLNSDMLASAGVKESPYIELLWVKNDYYMNMRSPQHYLVQLRDGPKVPETLDYVPAKMVVKNIVVAEGDLLEWETKAKKMPKGTVVSHVGGSLASHYAVHAFINGVPVLTTREPVMGETLLPTQAGESVPNIEDVRRGFYYGMTVECDYQSSCYMMLLGLHSTVKWMGKQDVLLGAALGAAYRLSITAAVGEWRHRSHRKTNKISRESTYSKVFNRIHKVSRTYMKCLKDFRQLVWPEGLGGDQWFQFTRWAAVIRNNVLAGDVKGALAAMNNAVNQSHNNGWGFNKFATDNAMTEVANSPVSAMLFCGPLAYRVMTRDEKIIKQADKWISKAKPLPIEQFNKWITEVPVDERNAQMAQAKITDDGRILVQYRLAGNSRCYSEQVITPDDDKVIAQLKAATKNMHHDSRLMASFAPNEKGEHIDNKALKSNHPDRQFFQLNKSCGTWVMTNPNTMNHIVIRKAPCGPKPPSWAQYTDKGTVLGPNPDHLLS